MFIDFLATVSNTFHNTKQLFAIHKFVNDKSEFPLSVTFHIERETKVNYHALLLNL